MRIAAIVIGRNEGERLVRCLASLKGRAEPIIYVDSGSTDGSVGAASDAGAEVVELDMSRPFTAARARNAGLSKIDSIASDGRNKDFVQVIDGDCELQEGWIETALDFLSSRPDVAVVAGRLRERFPEATVWNRLADAEWDTPVGETDAVGGIAILRISAVKQVQGFREDLIAGEEPELCLRLRRANWKIWRLDAEMALHDIAMTKFSQWWTRARRHGHAVAEGVHLHGSGPERYCVVQRRRALIWGAAVPVVAVSGMAFSPWSLLLILAWPAQMLRLKLRGHNIVEAIFFVVGKLPEAQGVLSYLLHQRGRS